MDATFLSAILLGSAALITSVGGTFGVILPLLRRQGRDIKSVNAAVNHVEPGEPPLRQVTLDIGTSILLIVDSVQRLEGKLDRQGRKLNYQRDMLKTHMAQDEKVQQALLDGQDKLNIIFTSAKVDTNDIETS